MCFYINCKQKHKMTMDIMQNQRQVTTAHVFLKFVFVTTVSSSDSGLFSSDRTCRCSRRTAPCFIQSCRRNKALGESFTTSPVFQLRSVNFHSLVSSSNNLWQNWSLTFEQWGSHKHSVITEDRLRGRVRSRRPPLLLLPRPFVCICFLPNYLSTALI